MGAISRVVVVAALLGCGCAPPVPSPGPVATPSGQPHVRPASPDFDGDDAPDVAVGLGTSTGAVNVFYAAGRVQEFTRADLDGSASAGFGQALLARDVNADGFTDLLVADPDPAAERGPALFWLFGSADGLDLSGPHAQAAPADSAGFGRSLALVAEPDPVLAVGAPFSGSDGSGAVVLYRLGADGLPSEEPAQVRSGGTGVPGNGRSGDAFGAALASTGALLLVGAPGKDIGGQADSGALAALTHTGAGSFTGEWITQGTAGVPDRAEAADRFGSSVAAGDGLVVVGAPLEDLEAGRDVGLVQPFRIVGQNLEPQPVLTADRPAGAGTAFGRALAVARLCAGVTGAVVGSTDRAEDGAEGAGAVWLVALEEGDCPAARLVPASRLGGVKPGGHVGLPVSALRTEAEGPDTLVIAARGEAEEGVLGGVWKLAAPYAGPAQAVVEGIRVHEERELALSPAPG